MIAVDTSVLIDWTEGVSSAETARLDLLLLNGRAALPPAVLAEIFSSPQHGPELDEQLRSFRLLELLPDFWRRAGLLRSELRARGRRAPLGDALIAQACIDADVPLLTRDSDFRVFAEIGGLKLA